MTAIKLLTVSSVALASLCACAQASVTLTFTEEGNNVIIRTAGTLTSTPNNSFTLYYAGVLNPQFPFIHAGTAQYTTTYDTWDVSAIDSSWGPGGQTHFTSPQGDPFFFSAGNSGGRFGILTGTTSLNSTIVIPDQTFASLGLTLGNFTYTLVGANGTDTATVVIAVPEPSTYAVLAAAAALAGVCIVRRRKRA